MTTRNPILEEIYSAREKLLADYEGDVHAYIEGARHRALASGRPIATPTQRTNRTIEAAKVGELAVENRKRTGTAN